jgi:uncharacterized protein
MLKAIGCSKNLETDEREFYSYIKDLLYTEPVCRMKSIIQHGDTTTFDHCLSVAYYNYLICKKWGLNARAGARAGLLHDLFLYDWHDMRLSNLHGFRHPKKASANASKFFDISPLERDIIEKHMFPLTLSLPKHRETFVITLTDKYCGTLEVLSFNAKTVSESVKKAAKSVSSEIKADKDAVSSALNSKRLRSLARRITGIFKLHDIF